MNGKRCILGLRLSLVLCTALLSQSSSAAEPETQYKYSDEWSLVSAPPPAGPYQPVNIDPRIPESDTIQQVPIPIPRLRAADEMPAEDMMQGQPDGTLSSAAQEPASAAMQGAPVMPPVPGHYKPVMSQAAGDSAVESASGTAATEQPPQYSDDTTANEEQKVTAIPATAETGSEEPVAEAVIGTKPEETTAVMPAPGNNAPELPLTAVGEPQAPVQEESAADMTGESMAGSTTGQEAPEIPALTGEMAAEPGMAASAPALTEENTAAEEMPGQRALTGELAAEPGMAASAPTLTEENTAAEEMPGQEEAGQPALTGELAAEPGMAASAPALTEENTAAEEMSAQEATGSPPAAGELAETPAVEESATAMQERPVMQAPMPGFYERLMPPAAGRLKQEQPVESPVEYLKGRPAFRPPAPGYYGRPMPSAPGYNYPPPGRYPYQSGMPGYWNMPPNTYDRGQEWPDEQDVPPPPAYDSMQYQRSPARGYR